MSGVKKRSTKRKKKQEATLVGDLFKILFAVSMLVVAILIAFFVFKNVDGFSLPDLRVTLAEPETNDPITVTISETKIVIEETTGVNVTLGQTKEAETTTDEVENRIESAEASVEAEEAKKANDDKENDMISEISDDDSDENKEKTTDENKDNKVEEKKETEQAKGNEESDHTDEAEKPKVIPENIESGVIDNGPVKGDETISESPVAIVDEGVVISNDGPVNSD